MKSTLLSSSLFGLQAAAFPAVMELAARQGLPSTSAAQAISKARTNCGFIPCTTFDASEQYVSTSGQYEYRAPEPGQIRGPCPGLNAAANHGYLDRSGVQTIGDTISGLGGAYGMFPDLAGFLAVYAIIFNGDPLEGTWSIGGPTTSDPLTSGLLGGAQGISYSHNVYEGDTSIARFDSYLNHGNAQELSLDRFRAAYETGMATDRYTLDGFVQDFENKVNWSIANNPYYFAPLFSTTLVAPAAYNFVINFMSNHTAEEPSGYLNGEMFKQFFAITGDYPNFKWLPGQERIPENWYRRPLAEGYRIDSVFEDLAVGWLAYPNTFKFGGNINGVKTYTGIDLANFTGGAYNLDSLLNYKNTTGATCFLSQFVSQLIPDVAHVPTGQLSAINSLIAKYVTPMTGGAICPQIGEIEYSLYDGYQGHTYQPTGVATTGGPATGDNKPDCCSSS